MNPIFKKVGSTNPGRSLFNLSYEKKFTCDPGKLIPVMCDEVVPGDVFKIGNQMILRCKPLCAPVLHQLDVYVHYFFVPYRLLWDDWENFITGGPDGDLVPSMPEYPTTDGYNAANSLWDYLGFPVLSDPPEGDRPMDFPRRAYLNIYNEYYRDETLVPEIDITSATHINILNRAWEKDYFTSALLEPQRGTAPALPIAGTAVTEAVFSDLDHIVALAPASTKFSPLYGNMTAGPDTEDLSVSTDYIGGNKNLQNFKNRFASLFDNTVTVDIGDATPIQIADLRLAMQIQRWMERNARAGVRYIEFLGAHFGTHPRDDRLQRPEYIGGSKCPLMFSEVVQTVKMAEPAVEDQLGSLGGHGISVNQEYIANYHAKEFGLIMGIMSVMPKPDYQQGFNRQWLRKTKFDFYFPEFAHLGEQAITMQELYAPAGATTADLNKVFGYAGAYDEMRTKNNMICAEMRDKYDYWHLSRQFGSEPALNQSFIECVPRKDFLIVQDEHAFYVQFGNLITALRPMPIIAEPGYLDHG